MQTHKGHKFIGMGIYSSNCKIAKKGNKKEESRRKLTDKACVIVCSSMNYMLTDLFYRPLEKTERSTSPVATMHIKGNEFTFF